MKKSESAVRLLRKIELRWPAPTPMGEGSLLEQGMLAVIVRHLPQEKAEAGILALRRTYQDWNELRVSQAREIADTMLGKGRVSKEAQRGAIAAARDLRDYLQEVFQRVHGLDLEVLREDPANAGRLLQQLPRLGLAAGSWVLWQANGGGMPVHSGLVRVLDRLGLVPRTGSMKKAGDAIAPLVEPGKELEFAMAFSEVADRWCDARKPLCQECVLVVECPHGRKVAHEWKVQQARLEAQRARDEVRRQLLERKEATRRAREEARARKKAEALAKKAERERLKRERAEQKRKAEEDRLKRRQQAEHKRAAAAKAKADKAARAKAARKPKAKAPPRKRSRR